MSRLLSSEEFDEKIKNRKIKRIDNYIKSKIKIRFMCNIDGYIWESTPNNIIKGNGCPKCSKHILQSNEDVDKMLKELNIKRISAYTGSKNKIKLQCKKCNNMWSTTSHNVLYHKTKCPKCAINHNMHTNDIIDIRIKNRKIKRIDDYIRSKTKIRFLCEKCNNIWKSTPNNILNGYGCPSCGNTSRGERKIETILIKNNIGFISQKTFDGCKNKKLLPFDFYIPSKNILIEFDGIQHYKPIKQFGGKKEFNLVKRKDKIKTNYCIKNNIKLIRIPYTEIRNIEKILNEALHFTKTNEMPY